MLYMIPMILSICMSVCVCMCAKNIRFELDYNFNVFEQIIEKRYLLKRIHFKRKIYDKKIFLFFKFKYKEHDENFYFCILMSCTCTHTYIYMHIYKYYKSYKLKIKIKKLSNLKMLDKAKRLDPNGIAKLII